MNPKLRNLRTVIAHFRPSCPQEERDQRVMAAFLEQNDDCLMRTNLTAHFTASAWILNPARDKVLMVYHNLYDSWSWTGGHADGDPDLEAVAAREAGEETGVRELKLLSREPVSLEIITVDGHEKRGAYVPSHLHLNLTYLMEAGENQRLSIKADENSGVRWIPVQELPDYVTEPWMMERIYRKISGKVRLTGMS